MLVLNGPADAHRITDPEIRALVLQRFDQVLAGEPYDSIQACYKAVV